MISITNAKRYCKDDIVLIENYETARADSEKWVIHHRLETHDKNGARRKEDVSKDTLIEQKTYYNRPADELIFMKESDHLALHNAGNQRARGNVLSKDTRKRMGAARVGNRNNGCRYIRCVETGEVRRVREWIERGFRHAYQVANGTQKTCKGRTFEYIEYAQ